MDKKLTRKERDFKRHRGEIMEVAEELFEKVGYYETTMDEIAKETEFSKGSLYNYFESKEILFFEILSEKGEIFKNGLNKRVNEAITLESKLGALIEFHLDYFSKNIGFFKIAQTEKYNLTNFTQKKLMISLREKYFNHIERIYSIIKLDKQKSEEESILIASAISGMLNGLITRNFLYEEKIEIERIKIFAKSKILTLIK